MSGGGRGGREKRREEEGEIMLFVPTGNFHWCKYVWNCVLDLDICGE